MPGADRRGLVKPTPPDLMEDTGSGLDYGTRPDRLAGEIVGTDRFFVRSHAATPAIDAAGWRLRIEGSGVRQPISLSYRELRESFPRISVVRTIECAGNRRAQFGLEVGRAFEGTQWGRTALTHQKCARTGASLPHQKCARGRRACLIGQQ